MKTKTQKLHHHVYLHYLGVQGFGDYIILAYWQESYKALAHF